MKNYRRPRKHRKLKIFLCVVAALTAVVTGYILISGRIAGLPVLNYNYNNDKVAAPAYPDVEFAVISDPHIYDLSLGSGGAALENAMSGGRKLFLDSIDLLDYAIRDILQSPARFVLVSGDLTKDGERINHEILAEKLTALTGAGIKVYVIPGNHDIENPGAVSYSENTKTPVETVTPEEFVQIYSPFGYNDALYRDPDSLSYVAEPAEGLWLLAVDACRYRENVAAGRALVGGKISQATADWMAEVLTEAAQRDKAVMVLMHHGAVEHWKGQGKYHPNFLIEDYRHFGRFLASHNIRLVFTGHYHAQDITRADYKNGKVLYDVQTGALVSAPCHIRYCSIKDNIFSTESVTVADKLGTGFEERALAFAQDGVLVRARNSLKDYDISDEEREILAVAIRDAFMAHYAGDEDPAERAEPDKRQLGLRGRYILFMQQYVLDGLWEDLAPADNSVSFSLQ